MFPVFNQNLHHNFPMQGTGLWSVPWLCIFRSSKSKLFATAYSLTWRMDSHKTMHFKHPGWERARCTLSFCEMNGWHQYQHTTGMHLHSVFPKWFCMSPNAQWLERLRRYIPLKRTQPAWGWLEKDLCAPSGLPYYSILHSDGWPMESWSISSQKLIPMDNASFFQKLYLLFNKWNVRIPFKVFCS